MGVEFDARDMRYVVVENAANATSVVASNRLLLSQTRSRTALAAFQNTLKTTLSSHDIDLIAVKSKPEKGSMRAGAAALKMEALLLATAQVEVRFVSGKKVKNTAVIENSLPKYLQTALLTALGESQV